MSDQEILRKLEERTTPELLQFREKLKQRKYRNDPQVWAIRFHIIGIVLKRHLLEGEEVERDF